VNTEPIVFTLIFALLGKYLILGALSSNMKLGTIACIVLLMLVSTVAADNHTVEPPSKPCELPLARIGMDVGLPIYAGDTIVFTDESFRANVTSRSWNFGEGTTSESVTETITYPAGKYLVELAVWGTCDEPTYDNVWLSVYPEPQVVDNVGGPYPVVDTPGFPLASAIVFLVFLAVKKRQS
jgi:hypothetical protein